VVGEPGPVSKKGLQGDVQFFGASLGVKEPSTGLTEKSGIVETGSPTSPKAGPQTLTQQVGQGLIWSIRNHEEKVRISLDPPQLGHVVLEIDRNHEYVKTTLWADTPQARAALESGYLEIQRIVENEGFKLEKFNVLVQQEMGSSPGRRESSLNPQTRDGAEFSEAQAPPFNPPDPLHSIRAAHPGSGHLDLWV
jgi:flagellar hook-length control protein FliK